jgi:hypothetical protein
MSRTGFLGRAGHLGLGELSIAGGLGPLTYQPEPPPAPPLIVLLPGFFGPPASSGESNVGAAAIYARGGGESPLFKFPPIPTGPEPVSSDANAAPIYARGGKAEEQELEERPQLPEPKSSETNAAPIYIRKKPEEG